MQPEFILTISPIGECKIEAIGFTDSESCITAAKPLEDLLGTVTEREMKPQSVQQKTSIVQQVKQ